MRPVPQICLDFLVKAEALKLKAYRDSAGVWTIGVGHTGPEVHEGLVWTRAECLAALARDAAKAASILAKHVKAEIIERLTDHQYSALISFVFNLGAKPGWTIWKVLNNGALEGDAVPNQMRLFNKVRAADGSLHTLDGLTNRRSAEIIFWGTPDANRPVAALAAVAAVPAPSSGFTREADTPPGATDTKPLAKSKSFMTGLATFGLTAAAWVSEHIKPILDAISPFATSSDTVARLQSTLVTLAAGAALATVIFVWLKKKRASAA